MCKASGDSFVSLRYIHCSTHMHKYSRYSVTTRDTMATDSIRFDDDEAPASCTCGPPRWRHYNPHSWPRSSIEYCTQICAYIVLDISMISPHLSPGSGLELWLCMCIYSQRTFVIQFRFVVSSIFKLFQTTLDPASVCEYECECV